jgi:hypothetical protein
MTEPEYRKAQVVVMKSSQGFADRLGTLNQCLLYCLKYHAVICVDWEDTTWDLPFQDLFNLVGVYSVPKAKVLEMIKQETSVSGKWTYEDVESPLNEKTLGDDYIGDWIKTDDAVRFKTEQPTEEILITNGRGMRLNDYRLVCATLKLKPDVADIVKRHLIKTDTMMIHLRGSDRKHEGFLEKMMEGFKTIQSWKPKYVIGDNKEMLDKWITAFPECVAYQPCASVMKLDGKATHLLTADELKNYGLTKRDLHIETLVDFFGLVNAKERVGMTDSHFFTMACAFGNICWENMLEEE